MIYMDSIKQTYQSQVKKLFSRIYKNSSAVFYTYDDILLKTYFEIAKSGDLTKLIKTGSSDDESCIEVWESIIKKQQQVSGSNQYNAILTLNKAYLIHWNNHTMIRACLILVGINHLYVDWEYIKLLKDNGYNIDTSTPERILETVKEGLHKCEVLVTKATSKRKELEKLMKQGESDSNEMGFEQILANLNFNWPNPVSEDIKLCTYNEYQKILIAKNKPVNGRN